MKSDKPQIELNPTGQRHSSHPSRSNHSSHPSQSSQSSHSSHQTHQTHSNHPTHSIFSRRSKALTTVIAMGVALAALLLPMAGCGLGPDQQTMERQARALWWSVPSISDGVYAPAVEEEVYSTEP
ncbi:hypothetical protein [Paenibacillus aceti]|nr:hypothetical protein [Paenibacillus aceti]